MLGDVEGGGSESGDMARALRSEGVGINAAQITSEERGRRR
jgi:hypothetical protein